MADRIVGIAGTGLSHPIERLSPRQRAVLFLISKGLHDSEIGEQLGISGSGVRYYIAQLFLIFDASNRTELAGCLGDDLMGELTRASTGAEPAARSARR
jgi:DNA-binding CsgD family transcriptional regulator